MYTLQCEQFLARQLEYPHAKASTSEEQPLLIDRGAAAEIPSLQAIRDWASDKLLREVEARFIILPSGGGACVRAPGLPATHPKDPADRIIGATALV
jgi:PIN domain nuclease of toxin-antitoxin system